MARKPDNANLQMREKISAHEVEFARLYFSLDFEARSGNRYFVTLNTVLMIFAISSQFILGLSHPDGLNKMLLYALGAIPEIFGLMLCLYWLRITKRRNAELNSLYSSVIEAVAHAYENREAFLFSYFKKIDEEMKYNIFPIEYIIILCIYFHGIITSVAILFALKV